jgi:hypothetical protein
VVKALCLGCFYSLNPRSGYVQSATASKMNTHTNKTFRKPRGFESHPHQHSFCSWEFYFGVFLDVEVRGKCGVFSSRVTRHTTPPTRTSYSRLDALVIELRFFGIKILEVPVYLLVSLSIRFLGSEPKKIGCAIYLHYLYIPSHLRRQTTSREPKTPRTCI